MVIQNLVSNIVLSKTRTQMLFDSYLDYFGLEMLLLKLSKDMSKSNVENKEEKEKKSAAK